jgi:hypothetical protein
MDRVFVFLVFTIVASLSLRAMLSDEQRKLFAKIASLYFMVVLTIYLAYSVSPLLQVLFPLIVVLNVCVCAFLIGFGSPRRMKTEAYLIFFYIFLGYYLLSSFMGNMPVILLVKKAFSISYIIAGICLGRTLLNYKLDSWLIRSPVYWSFPVVCFFIIFVAPQISNYVNTSVEGYQQLGDAELLNPNTFGLMVAPICVLCLLSYLKHTVVAKKIILAVVGGLAVLLLVRIGSRTSFLSAIIPSCYAFGFVTKSRPLRVVLFSLVGLLLAYMVFFSRLSELYRVFLVVQDGGVSLSSRDIIWEEGLGNMSSLQKIIGTGGRYVINYFADGGGGGLEGLHSALMECYFTTGIVGCSFAVISLCMFFLMAYKLQSYGMAPFCFVLMGLLTGVGECALLRGHWLVTVLFGVGLGLLSSRDCIRRNQIAVVPNRPPFLINPLSLQ